MLERTVLGAFAAHFGIPEGRHGKGELGLGRTRGAKLESRSHDCDERSAEPPESYWVETSSYAGRLSTYQLA